MPFIIIFLALASAWKWIEQVTQDGCGADCVTDAEIAAWAGAAVVAFLVWMVILGRHFWLKRRCKRTPQS
jgi:hypothetical protein